MTEAGAEQRRLAEYSEASVPLGEGNSMRFKAEEGETCIALYLQIRDAWLGDPPHVGFCIPGGPVPGFKHSHVLKIVSQIPAPNWWFRMWSRLFLGWRWEIEKKGPEE